TKTGKKITITQEMWDKAVAEAIPELGKPGGEYCKNCLMAQAFKTTGIKVHGVSFSWVTGRDDNDRSVSLGLGDDAVDLRQKFDMYARAIAHKMTDVPA